MTSEMLIAAIGNDTSCSADMITSLPQSTEPAQKLTKQTPTVAILNGNTLRTFEEIKKDVILTAIEHCNGNVKKAAKGLRIGYATIYHKLKKWKMSLKRKKKSVVL